MQKFNYISSSPDETKQIGFELANKVTKGDIIILHGDLGSGKTTFVKGFCKFFLIEEEEVTSPSFTLMNIYEGTEKIYHFDFYRISDIDNIDSEIFLEYIEDNKAIKLIEWNKIEIPSTLRVIRVEIDYISEDKRKINIIT
ncbi:MAG: tRNA (adenosine(37)-N6)-threonylcarbamoyltransferase complex ATPase subunit type 1 TsaE [Brevinematia bacterium]|jgi:tRNA threonylcarbamoyladenosine biosynthesis protein TsaE